MEIPILDWGEYYDRIKEEAINFIEKAVVDFSDKPVPGKRQ